MSLELADFAHHYEGHGLSDEQMRTHFDAFADLMECIVLLFWREDSGAQRLGISLDDRSLAASDAIESGIPLANIFNQAALDAPARKKEP